MLFGAVIQSAPVLLIALVVASVLMIVVERVRESWKINKLGGRARLLACPWFLFGKYCFPFR